MNTKYILMLNVLSIRHTIIHMLYKIYNFINPSMYYDGYASFDDFEDDDISYNSIPFAYVWFVFYFYIIS